MKTDLLLEEIKLKKVHWCILLTFSKSYTYDNFLPFD